MKSLPTAPSSHANEGPRTQRIFVINLGGIDLRSHEERAADEIVANIGKWIEITDPETTAVQFMRALDQHRLTLRHAFQLWETLESLKKAGLQVDVIRLVVAGAFSRNELISPNRVVAYLTRSDWPQLLHAWKEQASTREIRHIAKRLDRQRRAMITSAQIELRPNVEPRIDSDSSPPSLREVLEANLPTKAQPMAGAVAIALGILKMERKTWEVPAIVKRVQNILGSTARVADRLIEAAFRWLAQIGVVEGNSSYRIREEASDPLGRQILSMIA